MKCFFRMFNQRARRVQPVHLPSSPGVWRCRTNADVPSLWQCYQLQGLHWQSHQSKQMLWLCQLRQSGYEWLSDWNETRTQVVLIRTIFLFACTVFSHKSDEYLPVLKLIVILLSKWTSSVFIHINQATFTSYSSLTGIF